jgi:hypothetical protein
MISLVLSRNWNTLNDELQARELPSCHRRWHQLIRGSRDRGGKDSEQRRAARGNLANCRERCRVVERHSRRPSSSYQGGLLVHAVQAVSALRSRRADGRVDVFERSLWASVPYRVCFPDQPTTSNRPAASSRAAEFICSTMRRWPHPGLSWRASGLVSMGVQPSLLCRGRAVLQSAVWQRARRSLGRCGCQSD